MHCGMKSPDCHSVTSFNQSPSITTQLVDSPPTQHRSASHAGLAAGIALLGASGPAFTMRDYPVWWSAAECACLAATLLFLMLVHCSDPGLVEQSDEVDPALTELSARAAAVATSSLTITLQLDDQHYRLSRIERIWTRLDAGAHTLAAASVHCGKAIQLAHH